MTTIDTSQAVTRNQLLAILEATQAMAVNRAQLGQFADAIERELPAMVAKIAPKASEKCVPIPIRFVIERDPATGLMTSIVAYPAPELAP